MEGKKERECKKKLTLWCSRTFIPLITHDDLHPIMSTLGFVALPRNADAAWMEYLYPGPSGGPPLRLPYPRIDGLHLCTYIAFLDAVTFYLRVTDISALFHVRAMPLDPVDDLKKKWVRTEEYNVYQQDNDTSSNSNSSKECNSIIRNKCNDNPPDIVEPFE